MSNTIVKLVDTHRRTVYKLTGDAAEATTLKIDAGALNYSLNANSQILGAGTDRKSNYRLNLQKISYDVQPGDTAGYIKLMWNGDAPNTIITLSSAGELKFSEGGTIFNIPQNGSANCTGNVMLQAVGFNANGAYTVILDFVKNPSDYDTGRFADPNAFNVV